MSSSDDKTIKSAYDLALERLGGGATAPPTLTPEQKAAIADIEPETGAKLAEQEILGKSRIQAAIAAGDVEGAQKLQAEFTVEQRRIRDRGEERKEEIRRSSR
jgi:hypothetical protein